MLFDWCVLFGTPCTKTCLVVSNRRGNRKGRGKLGRLDHWPKGIEAKDGVWRDYYTGEQLEKYTKPWRNLNQDKNGDEAYNCINFYVKEAVTRSWTEWNRICWPRGCPCAYNYPPLLHLRCFYPATLGEDRVAELGSLSSGAKMAMKIFVKRVFIIFATNASFLRVIANLQI